MGYVQEVVANSIALQEMYETVGTAIELGGQDAKMIFFQGGGDKGPLRVADMRMNGSCAGGTGAFIDEMAAVLNIPVEEFDNLASKGVESCAIVAKIILPAHMFKSRINAMKKNMEQAALVVQETIINEAPYQVGDKIAQLVWVKFPTVNTTRVKTKEKLSKTERGEGGFGSTGK